MARFACWLVLHTEMANGHCQSRKATETAAVTAENCMALDRRLPPQLGSYKLHCIPQRAANYAIRPDPTRSIQSNPIRSDPFHAVAVSGEPAASLINMHYSIYFHLPLDATSINVH